VYEHSQDGKQDEETHKQHDPLPGALDDPADWRFINWLDIAVSSGWMRPLWILFFVFPLFHGG